MRRFIVLLSCIFTLTFCAWAEKWTPETLPMVHLQDARRYVCNPDDVLSQTAVDSADAILYRLEKDKGIQSVVVVVKHIEGDDPYQFGMELARKYGIGSKNQNTGLIVILATKDRSYQILTGTGLEGTLPDAICRRIQNRTMVPQLRKGNWNAAIVRTLRSIDRYVRNDSTLTAETETEDDNMFGVLGIFVACILLGIFTFIAALTMGQQKCPNCHKGTLRIVKRQRLRGGATGKWQICETKRCPRCGYEKTDYHDDTDLHGGMIPPIIMGGGLGNRGGGFGSGSFGGTFGGGSFGGGGSGGRF